MPPIEDTNERCIAELNRRVLAGRPIAASDLAELETSYRHVDDRWGPPGDTDQGERRGTLWRTPVTSNHQERT
jgi:hypothetical protein